MIGNRYNINTEIAPWAKDQQCSVRYGISNDGSLYVCIHKSRTAKQIMPTGEEIDADYENCNVRYMGNIAVYNSCVMYYNSLVDSWYDIIVWMVRLPNFIALYVMPDDKILIDFHNNSISYVIIAEREKYTTTAIYRYASYVEKRVIKPNKFHIFDIICNNTIKIISNESCEARYEKLLFRCRLMYTNQDVITAMDIKLRLAQPMHITRQLMDMTIVCTSDN